MRARTCALRNVAAVLMAASFACNSHTFAVSVGISEPEKTPAPPPPSTPTPETAKPPLSPQHDPALSNPSVDQRSIDQPARRGDVPAVAPTPAAPAQRAIPAIAPPKPPISSPAPIIAKSATPYPEGSVLMAMQGTLASAGDGDIIFAPDLPEAGSNRVPEPAMVLLPSQRLGQVRSFLSAMTPGQRVTISGQVFAYHGRNYLLPATFAIANRNPEHADHSAPQSPASKTPAPQTAAPQNSTSQNSAPHNATPDRASMTADPRVEDLMRSLEADRGEARVLEPTRSAAPGAAEPNEGLGANGGAGASLAPLAEGTLFSMRRGRLVRSDRDGGKYVFAFDNDPNSKAPGAMPLLPCRLLELMERTASLRGEDLVFRVSGRVTVFDGRNYLMPITYQVGRSNDVTPLQ